MSKRQSGYSEMITEREIQTSGFSAFNFAY